MGLSDDLQGDNTSYSICFYGIKATLPIEFEVELLRIAIETRLNDNESLRNMLENLEELDEKMQGPLNT